MIRLSDLTGSIEEEEPQQAVETAGNEVPASSKHTPAQSSDPWVTESALQNIKISEDSVVAKSDTSNRETEREKAESQLKEQVSKLNLPTVSDFRKANEKRLREMSWQERQAFNSQKNMMGLDPSQIALQRAIRNREKANQPVLFDSQLFESFRFKPDESVRKNKDGTPQLKRAPLVSYICGLHNQSKIILEQTYPERVASVVKAFPLNETHKKLELQKFQTAAHKSVANFFANHSALQYNVIQSMIREKRFESMGATGPIYAQLLGNLNLAGFFALEALKMTMSPIPVVQLKGKKFLCSSIE